MVDLLAQGVAIQAENFRGLGLVTTGVLQGECNQWAFNGIHYHFIYCAWFLTVEVFEITFQRTTYAMRYFVVLFHAARASS